MRGVQGRRARTRDKAVNKKNKNRLPDDAVMSEDPNINAVESDSDSGEVYTIDAAKTMKYEELFPIESKKFGYDPNAKSKFVVEALDDRVKKRADRCCK